MGMGIKGISSAFHLSRNTVRKYVRKYQESGLTTEQMLSMSEDKPQRHKNIRGREYYSQKPRPTNITSDKDNGNNK